MSRAKQQVWHCSVMRSCSLGMLKWYLLSVRVFVLWRREGAIDKYEGHYHRISSNLAFKSNWSHDCRWVKTSEFRRYNFVCCNCFILWFLLFYFLHLLTSYCNLFYYFFTLTCNHVQVVELLLQKCQIELRCKTFSINDDNDDF